MSVVAHREPELALLRRTVLQRRGANATLGSRDQETVEIIDEARRSGDEMASAGRNQPLGIQRCGQGIADALDSGSVIS